MSRRQSYANCVYLSSTPTNLQFAYLRVSLNDWCRGPEGKVARTPREPDLAYYVGTHLSHHRTNPMPGRNPTANCSSIALYNFQHLKMSFPQGSRQTLRLYRPAQSAVQGLNAQAGTLVSLEYYAHRLPPPSAWPSLLADYTKLDQAQAKDKRPGYGFPWMEHITCPSLFHPAAWLNLDSLCVHVLCSTVSNAWTGSKLVPCRAVLCYDYDAIR
jgi:hypothetical protein